MTDTTFELATLPPKESALQVYSAAQGLDPYLEVIKKEIDAFVPDVTTKKGRDAIASIAYKVAKSKTAMDNIGKELVAELKDVPKKVDAERKRMRDLLDLWKDQVRAPLTAWEEAEQARIDGHKTAIQAMQRDVSECNAAQIAALIGDVEAVQVGANFEEFEAEAHRAKAASLEALHTALKVRTAYEAEQAELAELRAKAAAQEQKDREEQIAKAAADQARQEAEAKAQAEREATAKREAEAKAATEQAALQAQLQLERAEREKAEAVQRELQAKADGERKAAEAVEAEQRRVAEQEQANEREAKLREADKAHKGAINRAAVAAFVAGGMTEDCAKQAVTMIAKKAIPAVSITY